jgi:Pyridine nucleotide-disulphide oxidoreductase
MTDFDLAASVSHWLAKFESGELENLFHGDSHWRDVLAITWRIRTVSGPASILNELKGVKARGFRIDPDRTPPRHVTRAGEKCIEAIFRFETKQGLGAGVVRLKDEKAWTLLTALDDLKGHQERVGKLRPVRKERTALKGEPAVLVVGGGQAGLSIAARLAQRQVEALVVDRWPRVGDNWRRRYETLTLHNQVHVNHLPYMPFPPTFPVYIPKDKLASWFEAYVEAMDLDYWTGTEFLGGTHADGRWSVKLRRNGEDRELHPRHVVMATGVSGIPAIPDIPALRNFSGKVIHSGQYVEGQDWKGRRALVIGTGNSGHDIAQDLYSAGAQVTIVQRSPTLIINCDPSAQLVYSLYSEGPPLEDCDLITASVPLALARKTHQLATENAKNLDKELLDRLERKGFRLCFGEDNTGWQFMYLTRGGGYYFNIGCSDLIAEGKIGLAQFSQLENLLKGTDLVVLATGWKGQEALVEKLFGKEVAERVGPIWGFGDGQELRNMFQRTAQPGLWFIAGSFAQSRIYSKYLALQIQASELGLI